MKKIFISIIAVLFILLSIIIYRYVFITNIYNNINNNNSNILNYKLKINKNNSNFVIEVSRKDSTIVTRFNDIYTYYYYNDNGTNTYTAYNLNTETKNAIISSSTNYAPNYFNPFNDLDNFSKSDLFFANIKEIDNSYIIKINNKNFECKINKNNYYPIYIDYNGDKTSFIFIINSITEQDIELPDLTQYTVQQ